jgi:hypothetical protein
MRQKTYIEASGVSSEQSRWTPQRYQISSNEDREKQKQWYTETMQRLFPEVIIDARGQFPPIFVVERRKERGLGGLRETLGGSENRRIKKTSIEVFHDFAGKVAVGQAVRFATCSVQRPRPEEIVVSYPDTGLTKTMKHKIDDCDDKVVEMVEVVRKDGTLEVKEIRIRFKDKTPDARRKASNHESFDPDFAPLSASMWFQYLCRIVKISDGTFQIDREMHAFERNVDHSKLGEIGFRNLAAKLAYLQRVRNIAPQTVIQQHLPVLLNYIDLFNEEYA